MERLQFVLQCCYALLLHHSCGKQIVDVCETQGRAGRHLQMAGSSVPLEMPAVFLRDRRWGGLEHVCEVSQATSENRSMNQAQHCGLSTCLQRGEIAVQERVFVREIAVSKKARLNRIDSSQYGSGRVIHCRGAIPDER